MSIDAVEESTLGLNVNLLEQPRSFQWEIFDGILNMISSFCFLGGSCMYFTNIFHSCSAALTIGGWLFTIGSFIFLLIELENWWDYRTGYCFTNNYYSVLNNPLNSIDNLTIDDKVHHIKIELNVYGTLCGSVFYLAGSILFIPIFNYYTPIGEWFFIVGSLFCCLSQIWKMYRSACNTFDHKFRLMKLFNHKTTLIMDILYIVGNICFFIGTILFIPYIDKTDFDANRAAFFFVFGSLCFTVSATILQYTIYCYQRK